MQTVELVKRCQTEEPEPIITTEHQIRVSRVLDISRPVSNFEMYNHKVAQLQEAGFHCFVGYEIWKKFKYHAGIRKPYEKEILSTGGKIGLGMDMIFNAVIVTAAVTTTQWALLTLLAITLIALCPILGAGTVKRQIKYVGDIPDFVMDNMEKMKAIDITKFTVHSTHKLPVAYKDQYRQIDPVMVGWLDYDMTFGVVVGIWDYDKEIKVL